MKALVWGLAILMAATEPLRAQSLQKLGNMAPADSIPRASVTRSGDA